MRPKWFCVAVLTCTFGLVVASGPASANVRPSGLRAAGVRADAPSNDDFANATNLPLDEDARGFSNDGATKEAGEPNHAGHTGGASVWYSFSVPVDTPVFIATCPTQFDTILGVYTGSTVSTLTQVVANDDSSLCAPFPNGSAVTFTARGGVLYHFAIDGIAGASSSNGVFVLTVDNNLYATPLNIPALPATATGTNQGTGRENFGEPPGDATVWYSFIAPATGIVTVDTCGSTFDTVLDVYTGDLPSPGLTSVVSNDDTANCGQVASNQSSVTFQAVNTVRYSIRVAGYNGQQGNIALHMAVAPGSPTIDNVYRGNGWATVAFTPHAQGNPAAAFYRAIAVPNAGPPVVAFVSSASRRAVLTGLTNGAPYNVYVDALNATGGASFSSSAAAVVPASGSISPATHYNAADNARLVKNATYFGTTPNLAQLQAVYVLAFLKGIAGLGAPTPVTPPSSTGPNTHVTTYSAADQGPLVTVMRQYALNPSEAQYFSTKLIGFLLALGGH